MSKPQPFSFLSCALVALVMLKCLGEIDWPWWAVLSPLWAPPACALSFLLTGGAVLAIVRAWRA